MIKSLKIICVLAAVAVSAGCACHTKKVGMADTGNIAVAQPSEIRVNDVNFAFDSYQLDETATSILRANAAAIKEDGIKSVQVEGHCDERGTNEYNMALGKKRASAAADFLASLGVDKASLSTVSYGEELPIDPAHNESAWAKNRRAHFVTR